MDDTGSNILAQATPSRPALIILAISTGVRQPVGESLMIEVPAKCDAIATATARAENWLQSHQASTRALNLVRLAIEELVTNCIKYGFNDAEVHTILVTLSIDQENLTVTVIDDGQPFDPLGAPLPDLSLRVQDRPVGGLGIQLLRQLSDLINYERRDGVNRFTLVKRLR